ncbi:His Kinase A (phospho-acceptor) domain-containing protein [Duganella sp. OV458]|nr:His Kinase A (phospho-acceptor) domain-containing protein [Duganella sp. OV458]SDK11123.1 His Kinase A (phospho-acceptor) domain-containing protein [Duganella sp. OV510]
MLYPIITVAVGTDMDIIDARKRARQIAHVVGLSQSDQSRISTAVSELTRNTIKHLGTGAVHFALEDLLLQTLLVSVVEPVAQVSELDDTVGVRRLIHQCDVFTDKEGARMIVMRMPLPQDRPRLTPQAIEDFARQLEELPSNVLLSAVQDANKELTSTVEALRDEQDKLILQAETLELSHTDILALNLSLDRRANILELADVRKDAFLAILSHELRGPLSAVGMAAQMLESPTLPTNRHDQMTQMISRQVMHMTRLVEDLLDVSRISQGLMSLNMIRVDMRDVVRYAIEQQTSSASNKQHVIEVVMPSEACMVNGESVRLVQVIGNLLGNAIRYTQKGGAIRISLDCADGEVVAVITDNGIGIEAEMLPHLFDLYVQAEPTSGRGNSGLGLGLALVKSLLEAHGGSVVVASEGKGRGSTFTVRLPQAAAMTLSSGSATLA